MTLSSHAVGEDLDALLAYIEAELGFMTSSYNIDYLVRRLGVRMRQRGVEGYEAYQTLLADDPVEAAKLLDTLSVNVTSFFRNPDMWEELRFVLRELTAAGPTRVWSAGSSDGREAYSVAMLALDDPEIDATRLTVVGTDIKQSVLDTARTGEYRVSLIEDLAAQFSPLSDFTKYVDRRDGVFAVTEDVKRLVRFERHDLTSTPPFTDVDLVLCRNLFIYIHEAGRQAMLDNIARALAPGGVLVIGMSEMLPAASRDVFTPVAQRLRIYRKHGSGPATDGR